MSGQDMKQYAQRFFPALLEKAMPPDEYEATGQRWEPEPQAITNVKDDFHLKQVQACIGQHALGVVAYAIMPVCDQDTLSVELQFAGRDKAMAFLKAYNKVRLHKPKAEQTTGRRAVPLRTNRMYILPDGREFWMYGKWDRSRRIGKVIAGRNPDGTCTLENEIVDEDVLRQCPVVPQEEEPWRFRQ